MGELRRRAVGVGALATVLVLVGLVVYRSLPGHATLPADSFWPVIGIATAGLLGVAALPWRRLAECRLGLVLLCGWSAFDIAMISALLAISGGAGSPLWPLYLLTTVFFAATYPWPAQLGLLGATVAAYAAATAAAGGVSPAPLALFVTCCCGIWVLAAFLSAQLAAAHRRLLEQERAAAMADTAAAVAHELRNPLAVLSNVVYLLRRQLGAAGEQARAQAQLGIAEREVATAARAVGNLLAYARPRPPGVGDVDVAELLAAALAGCPPPPGVAVAVRAARDLPAVRGDREQLLTVLVNVLANAVDAVGEAGAVELGAELAGGTDEAAAGGVRLWVRDDGPGIPAEAAETLFTPFAGTKTRGAGLGLAVVSRLLAGHGARLTVDCPPGGGTTVEVLLPVARRAAEATVGAH